MGKMCLLQGMRAEKIKKLIDKYRFTSTAHWDSDKVKRHILPI